jgi:hypothetical protein
MRYGVVFLALGLGLLAVEMSPAPGSAGAARDKLWLGDYAAARRAARQSGKPIFVVFR